MSPCRAHAVLSGHCNYYVHVCMCVCVQIQVLYMLLYLNVSECVITDRTSWGLYWHSTNLLEVTKQNITNASHVHVSCLVTSNKSLCVATCICNFFRRRYHCTRHSLTMARTTAGEL